MGACGHHVRMSEKVLTRLCQELWVFLVTCYAGLQTDEIASVHNLRHFRMMKYNVQASGLPVN